MHAIGQLFRAFMPCLILCLIGVQAEAACPDKSFTVAAASGSSDLRIQLHRNSSTSAWKGCLTITSCIWTTDDAKTDLPLEAEYTRTGHLSSGSPCGDVRMSGSATGGTIKSCSASSELASTLSRMADLISGDWKPSCSTVASVEQVEIDGTIFLRLPVNSTGSCMTAFIRRSDGAISVVLSSQLTCTKADKGLKQVMSELDPAAPTVIAGTPDYSSFITLRMPVDSNPIAVGLSASRLDYLNNTWLPALAEIWSNDPDFVGAPNAPLTQEAKTQFVFYLNYLTASAMRLDWLARGQVAPPIKNFEQVSSWMANIALSKGVDRRHSYFRAELLK